jgi:two-component sensor histidine kinase
MDVEKTIQFLLEQQARFDARQAQFDERQAKFLTSHAEFLTRQTRFEEDIVQINGVLLRVATAQERTNEILATLTERHVELAQSHKELSEAQTTTEQNLNALISSVERHIANHN